MIAGASIWGLIASIDYFGQKQREEDQAANQYAHYARAEEICGVVETAAARLACLTERIEAEDQRQNAVADLSAQSDMAKWAFAILWVGIVGLIVSGAGIFVIYETLRETRRMTIATRQIGVNQSRAYLSVTPTTFIRNGETNSCQLTIKNVGQTPARKVAQHGCIGTINWPPTGVDLTVGVGDRTKQTIAPGEVINIAVEELDCRQYVDESLPIRHAIFGIIEYEDVFGTAHKRRFCFEYVIRRAGPNEPDKTEGELGIEFIPPPEHNDET